MFSYQRERNATLVDQIHQLKSRIEQDYQSDSEVLGIFYGGSIGRGDLQTYSDVDLRVLIQSESYSQFIKKKRERTTRWGNVLFWEEGSSEAPYTIAHFDTFIKVDLFYYRLEDLIPSSWLFEIEIVFDPYALLKPIQKQSQHFVVSVTKEDWYFFCAKFLAHLHETYRKLEQDQYHYAISCVDKMSWSIVTGWYLLAGKQPNSYADWSKYEGDRSALQSAQLKKLSEWTCKRDKDHIWSIVQNIIHEFREVELKLAKLAGVNKRDRLWISKAIALVVDMEIEER